jgi:serine phosphatase RsbU (regulator of sigma subunit)
MSEELSKIWQTGFRPVDPELLKMSRADQLFAERYDSNLRRVDRLFAGLMVLQWLLGIVIAVFFSPRAWAGKTHVVDVHFYLAFFAGGILSALPIALALMRPGKPVTRFVIACAQMLWSALLIHLTGGRIETHFHVFGSLAFLAFYRDWRVLVPATLLVAADRLGRQLYWPESVYGITNPEQWRFLEHVFWVIFEDVFLVIACVSGVREMRSLAKQQAHIEYADKVAGEMEIATRIQTSILPGKVKVPGLEISTAMQPAAQVGGDYYDLIPVEGGCWIGIGDVAGHGLKAGLIMLQAQSAFEALVSAEPSAPPRELVCRLNQVMFENIRRRMKSDEHMTMSLIRYTADGRIVVAGAHEEILVCAADGACRSLAVSGTWLGGMADVRPFTDETEHRLEKGDVMVLYSDGVTEAQNEAREMFGPERVSAIVAKYRLQSVDRIRNQVLDEVARWSNGKVSDDVTLLVIRHVGVAASSAAA